MAVIGLEEVKWRQCKAAKHLLEGLSPFPEHFDLEVKILR